MLNLPETKRKVCHEAGTWSHSFHHELDTDLAFGTNRGQVLEPDPFQKGGAGKVMEALDRLNVKPG
jgi:hypothetical protein